MRPRLSPRRSGAAPSSVIADSSGNAGSAIAAYAARAGIGCTVYVPASTSPAKRRQILAYGAQLEVVAGDRSATAEAAATAVQRTGATYASHVYDPYFLQGTKTIAYEIWEQAGNAPDALIVPVGNGTLLLGAARGFAELRQAGLVRGEPTLIAVQSERCAPLARAWAEGAEQPIDVEVSETARPGDCDSAAASARGTDPVRRARHRRVHRERPRGGDRSRPGAARSPWAVRRADRRAGVGGRADRPQRRADAGPGR